MVMQGPVQLHRTVCVVPSRAADRGDAGLEKNALGEISSGVYMPRIRC